MQSSDFNFYTSDHYYVKNKYNACPQQQGQKLLLQQPHLPSSWSFSMKPTPSDGYCTIMRGSHELLGNMMLICLIEHFKEFFFRLNELESLWEIEQGSVMMSSLASMNLADLLHVDYKK